jgi:long-chain fatty acid transport protein
MMARNRLAVWLCCHAALTLAAASAAQAGGFAVRQQSAYGAGASFAGIAAGGSLSSIFWNPANLADVRRIEIEITGSGVFAHADVKLDPLPALGFGGSNEGNIAEHAFIPAGYGAYRVNERVVIGVGINVPYGLTTKYDNNSVLSQNGIAGKSEIKSLNVNPAISVDVTDWLALALGAQIEYFDARLTRQALGPLGISTLKGDDVGFGFTAGIRFTPVNGTDLGLGYRSFINHKLDGELETPNAGVFNVDYDGVNLPDTVTLGLRQRITERLRVMAGAEWSNWSRFDTVEVEGGPAPIELPFDYDDGWFFALGGEFDVTQRAAVRAGISYDLSPIGKEVRNFRLPYNDALAFSIGASYQHDARLSLDLGYSFSKLEDAEILADGDGGPEVNGPFSGHVDPYVHYVMAAIKLKL